MRPGWRVMREVAAFVSGFMIGNSLSVSSYDHAVHHTPCGDGFLAASVILSQFIWDGLDVVDWYSL